MGVVVFPPSFYLLFMYTDIRYKLKTHTFVWVTFQVLNFEKACTHAYMNVHDSGIFRNTYGVYSVFTVPYGGTDWEG